MWIPAIFQQRIRNASFFRSVDLHSYAVRTLQWDLLIPSLNFQVGLPISAKAVMEILSLIFPTRG